MRPVKSEDIEALSELMTEGFINDPKNGYQLRDLERKYFILKTAVMNQLRGFMDDGDVYTLDNCRGLVIGYDSRKIDFDGFIKIITAMNDELMKTMTEEEIQRIMSNSEDLAEVDNPFWFHGLYEEYYHFMTIVIDKELKGSGAFRELISPLLEKKIPIVLETHNESNVPIYEHFGFEVVQEFSNERVNFKQYCMVRKPDTV